MRSVSSDFPRWLPTRPVRHIALAMRGGFTLATTRRLAHRYVGGLDPELANDEEKHELKKDFQRQSCAMRYTIIYSIAGIAKW